MAWVGSHNIFNFDAHNYISGTADVRVVKFCVLVEYIEFYACDDKLDP